MAPAVVQTALTGNPVIDPLLDGERWENPVLTVGFPVAGSSWEGYDPGSEPFSDFAPLTASQQVSVNMALLMWSRVANLTFVPASEPAQPADLRFGGTSLARTAYGYFPNEAPQGGDVWFGPRLTGRAAWTAGNYSFTTVVHEIGHTLGLKHPHDAGPGIMARDPAADSIELSVMSYRSYAGAPLTGFTIMPGSYPIGPMVDDVAAIQHLYGANYATNAGNTVYRFTPADTTVFQTIWDGGGADTYDLSAYATPVSVDLAPGAWSTFSTAQLARLDAFDPTRLARGNVANAYLSDSDPRGLIENAIGGAGSDTIVGNQAINTLIGGGGGDLLVLPPDATPDWIVYSSLGDGGAPGTPVGHDTILGFEGGVDSIILTGALAILVDGSGDRALQGASRGNGIDGLPGDELVKIATPLASLTDVDFMALRGALATMMGAPPGHDVLALASDGTNSGAYLIQGGGASPMDVRLLGLFNGTPDIGLADIRIA